MYKFGFLVKEEKGRHPMRLKALGVLGVGLVVLLGGRLIQLQVIHGQENRERADSNRIVVAKIRAPRGAIFDRNNEPLTRNIPIYKLGNEVLTREEAKKAGEEVMEDVGREYVYPEAGAHVVGYVDGDYMGRMGIEKIYEDDLRGIDGGEVIERGASGEKLRTLAIQQAQPGKDVKLTIDAGLQRKAHEIMVGRKGVVIASDPRNGEILALVSSPAFNPHGVEKVLENEDKPLFNRALAGLYPPGSVFKIVTATAGLQEGAIDEETEIEDTGEIKVGVFRFGNWYFDQYGKTEGVVDIIKGLQRSNDIFFYKTGELTGADKIALWAEKFGFGKTVGLNLGGEAEGVVPSPEWKERFKGEKWFLGNTYHFAIGQGDLQVTPMQVQQMNSAIANNGKLCKPHIAQMDNGKWIMDNCRDLGISQKNVELIRKGMEAACSSGGTAFPFFDFSPKVACKTGTAQFNDPLDRTHAWLTVFAPAENPEIVVTVLLEAAGEGSYQAAPVAKELLQYWFHER